MAGPSTSSGEETLLGGRYSLRERIGSGGMASVWLADDTRLDRDVAVKLLAEGLSADDAFNARFRREARVAASLAHPNLVSIFDFDPDPPRPYLVMEYVPGPNLATRLERGDVIQGDRVAADLLSALVAIHRAGIVHRDVKPANVLLAQGGRAMLTDFGIARPEDATSITQAGQMPGTKPYMAPELLEGEPASPSTDLYACGVLLRELVSPEMNPAVSDLAGRMAAPDPPERPPSAQAALAELPLGAARRLRVPFDPDIEAMPGPEAATDVIELAEEDEAEPADATPPLIPPGREPAAARDDRPRLLAAGALMGMLALVVLIAGLTSADQPEIRAPKQKADSQQSANTQPASDRPEEREQPAPAAGSDEPDPPEPAPQADPVEAAALNDQGYALIQAGRFDEAIPILRQSVALFGDNTDDINYAFALFNLGHALREAGRPDEAIPILRERLQYPNQTETVQAELEAAIAEAGGEPGTGAEPPEKVPPGQAKKEKVPPGHQDA